MKNRSTLNGLQDQEWPRMDTNLAVSLYSVFNALPESSGIPIFSGFSEIGDLRQAKTKNSDENLILQTFGEVFLSLHSGLLS